LFLVDLPDKEKPEAHVGSLMISPTLTKAREICKITRKKSILQGPKLKMSLCKEEN
jgi:hypothetical protein